MAEPTRPMVGAPIYDIDPAYKQENINPAGIGTNPRITAANEEALNAQEKLADTLEQRYAQPNWFNVAAGFLKPQLGGFMASLGSAGEALGQNVEAQRAIAPTIARMRAQVAAARIPFEQKSQQINMLESWRKTGKPMDPTTYQKIMELGSDTDAAKSATQYYEATKAAQDIQTRAAETMRKEPLANMQGFIDFNLNPSDDKAAREKRDAYIKNLETNIPRGISPEQWGAMSIGDRAIAQTNFAEEQRKANMSVEERMREVAEKTPSRLALLGEIRDLSLGAGIPDLKDEKGNVIKTGQQQMAELLNFFGGNNPIDAIARAAADGKILKGSLEGFDNYIRQIKMTPEARDKFQELVKLLANNQADLRNSSVNPTDQFGALQAIGSPGIANSQKALVTLVDLMANSDKFNLSKYQFTKEKKIPYGYLELNPEFQKLNDEFIKRQREISSRDPFMASPSSYSVAPPKVTERPSVQTFGGVKYERKGNRWVKMESQQ